jgi:hypothetical protein
MSIASTLALTTDPSPDSRERGHSCVAEVARWD